MQSLAEPNDYSKAQTKHNNYYQRNHFGPCGRSHMSEFRKELHTANLHTGLTHTYTKTNKYVLKMAFPGTYTAYQTWTDGKQ